MIDRNHALPITRQATLLDISRGAVYYQPKPISPGDQMLMNRIDRLHLELPFAGSRLLRDLLAGEDFVIGRKHVRTLMHRMGITAIDRRAHTSHRHPAHPVYLYLLRQLVIKRPNQVWAADITYIPMARGFVYLVAILDWCSRKILVWRVSNILTADFCIKAVEEAIARHGVPEIFNSDQGSQLGFKASSQHWLYLPRVSVG